MDLNGNLQWSWEVGDGNGYYAHYQGLESQTSGFLLLSGDSQSNLLVRISNPPRNDTLHYNINYGGFLILLVVLVVVTSILIYYQSNQTNSSINSDRNPTNLLLFTLYLYGFTLFLWLNQFRTPLQVYPDYGLYSQNYYLGWGFDDVLFLGSAVYLPIILGMLTFAALQSAIFYLETRGAKSKLGNYRLKGHSVFSIFEILFAVLFSLLLTILLPWVMLPFLLGILLIGFYPKYLLMRLWVPKQASQ